MLSLFLCSQAPAELATQGGEPQAVTRSTSGHRFAAVPLAAVALLPSTLLIRLQRQ